MGVTHKIIKPGDGENYPSKGDTLLIHYTGRLKNDINGKPFDASRKKEDGPFECKIGAGLLIKGWEEGIMKLSLGEKATLDITSDYGYGDSGFGSVIPPKSDLIFEVELVGINDLRAEQTKEKTEEQTEKPTD